MQSTADDRRLHRRRAVCHPLTLQTADGVTIPCESIDVSVGGMKVRSTARIPLGPTDIVVSSGDDDTLVLRGDVVEELLDVSTGEVTARIVFPPAPPPALGRTPPPTPARRRGVGALAAAVLAGVLVAGGAHALTRDDAPTAAAPVVPAALTDPAPSIASSPLGAPPHVAPAPPPAPDGSGDASEPDPARSHHQKAVTADPAPAPVTRVDRTDDLTRVVLGATAEDTSVQTTTRPSPEGDDVHMQLDVTPEPDGTVLPVAVRIENRGTGTITFTDGIRVTVAATHDGAAAASTTLTSDVTELAAGESIAIGGVLDFGATGEFDVTASTEVTGS